MRPSDFYPRSPCGERLVQPRLYPASTIFLSTLSLRRATSPRRSSTVTPSISIHALLAESDQWFINGKGRLAYFYPRSPCGERPVHYIYLFCLVCISIHALLAESDRSAKSFFCGILVISIHALLAESDWESNVVDPFVELFLSTLSLRRATMLALNFCTVINISIHALLAESDRPAHRRRPAHCHFYPRSPCGERRAPSANGAGPSRYFYPRSPCGERLCNMHSLRYCCTNFYPRSPCGERPRSGRPCRAVHKFLSTLSLRRATGGRRAIDPETGISIHALLAESDFMQQLFAMQQQAFLSTLSLRRATYRLLRLPHRQAISIHALLAESDAVADKLL